MKNNFALYADFDGTLFAPNWKIIFSPFFNLISKRNIEKSKTPFIVITGRPEMSKEFLFHLRLFCLPSPTAIAVALGTDIYLRGSDGKLVADEEWKDKVTSDKTWNKQQNIQTLEPIVKNMRYSICDDFNEYLIRIKMGRVTVNKAFSFKKYIEVQLQNKAKCSLAETRKGKNTEELFEGYLLITPAICGKDNVLSYFLDKKNNFGKKEAVVIGDGVIDVPMLTLPSPSKDIVLTQHLVSGTYLAEHAVKNAQITNKHLFIEKKTGPEFISNIFG